MCSWIDRVTIGLLLSAVAITTVSAQDPTATSPERFVAEATIRVRSGDHEYAYLPATVRGRAVTIILDMGSTTGLFDPDWGQKQVGAAVDAGAMSIGMLDSVTFGSVTKRHLMVPMMPFKQYSIPGLPPAIGLFGMDVLSRYDELVDVPHHSLRLYVPAPSANDTSSSTPAWLPPGLTPVDCAPLRYSDENLVVLDLTMQGHPITGFFDSGAKPNAIDGPAAEQMGLLTRASDGTFHPTPSAHLLQVDATTYLWKGVEIVVDGHTLPPQTVKINTVGRGVAIGLDGFRDRVLWVSNTSKRICIGGRTP